MHGPVPAPADGRARRCYVQHQRCCVRDEDGAGRATNRPALSRRGSFCGIEALISLPCSISYYVGLFSDRVFLPGTGLIGRGLVQLVWSEEAGGELTVAGCGKRRRRPRRKIRDLVARTSLAPSCICSGPAVRSSTWPSSPLGGPCDANEGGDAEKTLLLDKAERLPLLLTLQRRGRLYRPSWKRFTGFGIGMIVSTVRSRIGSSQKRLKAIDMNSVLWGHGLPHAA